MPDIQQERAVVAEAITAACKPKKMGKKKSMVASIAVASAARMGARVAAREADK